MENEEVRCELEMFTACSLSRFTTRTAGRLQRRIYQSQVVLLEARRITTHRQQRALSIRVGAVTRGFLADVSDRRRFGAQSDATSNVCGTAASPRQLLPSERATHCVVSGYR